MIQKIRRSIHQQVDDLLHSPKYKNITLKERKLSDVEDLRSAFAWFMLTMAETISLVICGYFNNPYEDINQEDSCCEVGRLDWIEESDD